MYFWCHCTRILRVGKQGPSQRNRGFGGGLGSCHGIIGNIVEYPQMCWFILINIILALELKILEVYLMYSR